MNAVPDTVMVRISRGDRALPVMRVVMGGMALRHDLPLDRLDDLQLAVETLVAEESPAGPEYALEVSNSPRGLHVRLDGLENQDVKTALLIDDPFQRCRSSLAKVRLFLDSLVDRYWVVETAGGSYAVEMEK